MLGRNLAPVLLTQVSTQDGLQPELLGSLGKRVPGYRARGSVSPPGWEPPRQLCTDMKLSIWETPPLCLSGSWVPSTGPALRTSPASCPQQASYVLGTQTNGLFCGTHPSLWCICATVANFKLLIHVKSLKTVFVRKTTAVAHWPSASSGHRQ